MSRGRELPTLDSQPDSLFLRMQVDANRCRWTVKQPKSPIPLALLDIPGLRWTSMWWAHQDSNLEPRDYESPALTVEL